MGSVPLSKLFTLNTVAELICFLVALIFLYRDKSAAWRLLIVYLLLTFAAETTGLVIRKVFLSPNLPVYNTFVVVECFFTSYFFYTLFKPYGYSMKWLFGWLALFTVMYISELFYVQFADFVAVTASIMSIVFVLACMWFYYLKLTDERYEPLLQSAEFWWVSGALFFYFGSTACNIFFDYLKQNEVSTYNSSIRYIIFNVLNIILYSFWSFSSVCRYRQRKSFR
ncbi:hypothetical protein [Mucilaginibacter sp.]|uniref:hypothetical protein n=1 Tax=Mucilaginibacter sp. TaxID=1882438 RepID=UPI0032648A30